jgi:hypothetical protein
MAIGSFLWAETLYRSFLRYDRTTPSFLWKIAMVLDFPCADGHFMGTLCCSAPMTVETLGKRRSKAAGWN